jgi:hypothetical protein
VHALHALQASQLHVVAEQARVRVCRPRLHAPQAWVCISLLPGVHCVVSPAQLLQSLHASRLQVSAEHMRERVWVPVLHDPHF